MKECKIIHINDGNERTLTNGNFHFAEDVPWAEKMLALYLNAGYEISQMIPEIDPGRPGNGYPFYRSGFTVVLTREASENAPEITLQDWERLNVEEVFPDKFVPPYEDESDLEKDSYEYSISDFADQDFDFSDE